MRLFLAAGRGSETFHNSSEGAVKGGGGIRLYIYTLFFVTRRAKRIYWNNILSVFQHYTVTGKWRCPISCRIPRSPAPPRCAFMILQQQLIDSYCRRRSYITNATLAPSSPQWMQLYPDLKAINTQTEPLFEFPLFLPLSRAILYLQIFLTELLSVLRSLI